MIAYKSMICKGFYAKTKERSVIFLINDFIKITAFSVRFILFCSKKPAKNCTICRIERIHPFLLE